MSTKLYPSHLLLAIVVLLSIGAWAGCRSTDEPGAGAAGPSITATATADLIIVERGTPRLTRVQPVPRHVILSSGETIGMSAVAFDQEGRQIKGVSFNWQGVDPEVGSITSSGVLRAGFTKGTFKDALVVTAQPPAGMGPGLVQGTASVTVAEFDVRLPPTRVRVFPEKLEVETSGTYRLVALAVDANGVAIPNMKFKWEVLEPGLPGTIAQNGQFTASKSAGQYLDAIRVTLVPQAGVAQAVSTGVDVHVLDPRSASSRISATVLPQVISIRPGEQMRYTAMLLDRRGQQITPVEPRWEMLDSGAGSISSSGRFAAGEVPGIYSDAILVSMGAKGAEGLLTARGTVIIVESALLPSPEPAGLARVAIFPERVVLSPGESTRVSIVGVDGALTGVPTADIRWSLNPPEVGEVSRFVNVTARDFPGVYEGAIRAVVTVETEAGPVTKEVSATLVIRDSLASVDVTPGVSTLTRGERMQFQALAYDRNRVLLPDVFFRWSLADSSVGTIDRNGLFTAKGGIGEYPGVIRVEAVQRLRAPP